MPSPHRFLSENTLDPLIGVQYQYITQIKTVTTLHDHDFFELFLVAYGEVEHECNGHVARLQPGDMMLMRAPDLHCYHPINNGECGLFNLAFSKQLLASALKYLTEREESPLLHQEAPPYAHLNATELRECSQWLQEINTYPPARHEAQGIYVRQLLARLLARYFLTSHPTGDRQWAPPWLERIHREMQRPERLSRGAEAMLELCPYTKEHLYRQFQKYYHETPGAFTHRLRLSYAANLLAHTDASITQAALEAGYENLGYFYQCFKIQYAMTPREYRTLTRKDAVGQVKED